MRWDHHLTTCGIQRMRTLKAGVLGICFGLRTLLGFSSAPNSATLHTSLPFRVFIVRQEEPLSGCQDGPEKDVSLLWEGSKHLKMLITGTHLLALLRKKLRHKDHKSEANLGSIARPRLSKSRGLEGWLTW